MRLPKDKNYLTISFYIVLSLSLFYIIKTIVDINALILMDIGKTIGRPGLFIKRAANILSPLLIALVISYLLDPIVSFIQRKAKISSRRIGVVIVYGLMVSIFAAFTIYTIGFGDSSQPFSGKINEIQTQLNDMLNLIRLTLIEWNLGEGVVGYFNRLVERLSLRSDSEITRGLTSAGRAAADFFIGLIVAFYFLANKEKFMKGTGSTLETILGVGGYNKLKLVLSDLHGVFSGYIRGQAIDAVIMSILIGGGLKVIGVEFAILIGIITGFTNLIPFLGALVGFALSIVMALITGPPMLALYAAVYVIIIQQIDSMIIIPKIVGKKVDLSPVVVILAVVIGGRLAGFFGMVFAVPICAVLKIWLSRFMETLAIKRTNNYNHNK